MAPKRDSKGRFASSGGGSKGPTPKIPAKKRAQLKEEIKNVQRMVPKKGEIHSALARSGDSRSTMRDRAAQSFIKERKRVRAYEAKKVKK